MSVPGHPGHSRRAFGSGPAWEGRLSEELAYNTDIKKGTGIRRELNNLLAEHGLVNHDALAKKKALNSYKVRILEGFNGTHGWDGKVTIASHVHAKALEGAQAMAKGARVTNDQADAVRTLVHEAVHGHSPILQNVYRGVGAHLEEATTELTARSIAGKLLNRGEFFRLHGSYPKEIRGLARGTQKVLETLGLDDASKAYETAMEASVRLRKGVDVMTERHHYAALYIEKLAPEFAARGKAVRAKVEAATERAAARGGKKPTNGFRLGFELSREFSKEVTLLFDGFDYKGPLEALDMDDKEFDTRLYNLDRFDLKGFVQLYKDIVKVGPISREQGDMLLRSIDSELLDELMATIAK